MNLSVRIFLGYFLLVGVAIWFVMQSFIAELVPGMRQSLEEVLVDTANLLAEVVKEEVARGAVDKADFSKAMTGFSARKFHAVIWSFSKRDPSLIVYITDAAGLVIYDSRGRDVGKDYSSWNDVFLTLHGQYGTRTTREDPKGEFSSIMYVAAPINSGGRVIGVLTVGKPSVVVQPFVDAAVRNIKQKGVWVLLISVLLGLLVSYWLTLSIRRLTHYAQGVQQGRRVQVPRLRERELAQLADAMEGMRTELEGKHYVENYLHALTHELKSPLAAIQGAAELLDEEMPRERQKQFLGNICNESARLKQVVEHLLNLAALEKRSGLEQVEAVAIDTLVAGLCKAKGPVLAQRNLRIEVGIDASCRVEGERFLLQQAISNLLDNAIEFSPPGGLIEVSSAKQGKLWVVSVRDHGPGIPDYAQARLFERFYSLARPDSGRKSTGLGLSLVLEVAELHGGSIIVTSHPQGGALAQLQLPALQ